MASPEFDVCIIGYGPVGAGLANLLGLSGLKTVVLEREPSVHHLPRAVALDGEGMRLIQTMGLADELLPRLNVSRNIRHVSADGKLLLLLTRSGVVMPIETSAWRRCLKRHASICVEFV